MKYEDYGRKMLIYAGIAIVGIFFGIQGYVWISSVQII
jgi:hypothetical protein